MTPGRYAEALQPTLAWLAIEHRGWGAVVAPASEQREIAEELARQVPSRPVFELGADTDADWFTAPSALAVPSAANEVAPAAGGFTYFARDLDEPARERLLKMLNQQRDRTSDRGVWTLVISARELAALRRHAPDLASVLRSIETVAFIPRTLSEEELVAARAELHAYYQRRFGRLDLRGFIRSEHEDVSFPVEAIYQPLEGTVILDDFEPLEDDRDDQSARSMSTWEMQARIVDLLHDMPRPNERVIRRYGKDRRQDFVHVNVIVGGPGSGKSFFLRWCALEASGNPRFLGIDAPIPLYFSLAVIRATPLIAGLDAHIVDSFLDADLAIAHVIAQQSRAGKVIFLLDGLDEAGPEVQHLADEVRKLAIRYPWARIVVTSRPTEQERLSLFGEPITVAGFDGNATSALLRAWCELYEIQRVGPDGAAAGRTEGARLAEDVLASPQLRELAQSPLLATIIAIVHRAGVHLPEHRVELYDHIARILVERWNQLRSRELGPHLPTIRTADAIRLLGPVAYEMVKTGNDGAIAEGTLRDLLTRHLSRGTVRVLANADEAITAFRNSLGLLVEQAPGVYGFLHKTLGEFMAAHEAVRTDALESMLEGPECFSPSWREVILLALGIVGRLQANDDRLQAAVELIVGRARLAREDRNTPHRLHAAVSSLLAQLVVDDPGLSPLLAERVCAELVPNWWFERAGAARHVDDTMSLGERILRGPWRSTLANRLLRWYGRGLPSRVLHRGIGLGPMPAIDLLVAAGASAPMFLCEWVTALLLSTRHEFPILSLPFDDDDVFKDALARQGAGDIIRLDASALAPHRRSLVAIPDQPSTRRGRLPLVLAAWRDLAATYADGPQPPASVEAAIARYGPPADAGDAKDDGGD